jgi:hypothetical protein
MLGKGNNVLNLAWSDIPTVHKASAARHAYKKYFQVGGNITSFGDDLFRTARISKVYDQGQKTWSIFVYLRLKKRHGREPITSVT